MTTDIDERTAVREAALVQQLTGQRRLAMPEDYVFDKSQEAFWDLKDGTLHTEKAVDASIPQELWRVQVDDAPEPAEGEVRRGRPARRRERLIPPSRDIQRVENDQFVEGSTWWPGMPQMIRDWFIDANGFFKSKGRRVYNQYKPPPDASGPTNLAEPWIAHVKRLWPEAKEHEFFFDYCAHMVQHPEDKCNAGIVLSGAQRIGKDAALRAIKGAVGAWNTKGIDPDELFSPYKPWLQTLMLVVDEVRPSKDEFHATAMYNILKPLLAAPPDTLPLNDKYAKLRYVINVMRVFITTNDWMAMYIPPGDGRMFIMHSTLQKGWHIEAGLPNYFIDLFGWLDAGGSERVAAWLAARDLSQFNPKAEVVKTAGWEAVAGTWEEPEDGIGFALEALGKPEVVFGAELVNGQFDYQDEVAAIIKSPRKIGHRMQRSGYMLVKCPYGDRWVASEEGFVFRSRLAFVKQSAGLSGVGAVAAIEARAKAIVTERAAAQHK